MTGAGAGATGQAGNGDDCKAGPCAPESATSPFRGCFERWGVKPESRPGENAVVARERLIQAGNQPCPDRLEAHPASGSIAAMAHKQRTAIGFRLVVREFMFHSFSTVRDAVLPRVMRDCGLAVTAASSSSMAASANRPALPTMFLKPRNAEPAEKAATAHRNRRAKPEVTQARGKPSRLSPSGGPERTSASPVPRPEVSLKPKTRVPPKRQRRPTGIACAAMGGYITLPPERCSMPAMTARSEPPKQSGAVP